MVDPIEVPVFGRLVRDKWGGRVTLREFPFFPEFARSDRMTSDDDAQLINDWQHKIDILAPKVREWGLRAGLHRKGVFEVYVESDAGKIPSAAQTAAFAAFLADEQRVCRNTVDAMLRFYRSMCARFPQIFELSDDDLVFPKDPNAAALASVLEFDCLTVQSSAVAGVAPLVFSWRPAWDEEHGLKSFVYAGQVLSIGTDEVDNMESWPSDECFSPVWNRSVMTPAEIAAYETYRDAQPGV